MSSSSARLAHSVHRQRAAGLHEFYIRLRISETPAFRKALEKQARVSVFVSIFTEHKLALLFGTAALATFVLFYIMTVFSLSWGTTKLAMAATQFLPL